MGALNILLERVNIFWITIITIYIIVSTAVLFTKNNNINNCLDTLYFNYSISNLFLTNLVLNIIVCISQLMIHITSSRFKFINDMICFVFIAIVLGLYLNFIIDNKNNCLNDINIINSETYILFILSFVINIITSLIILSKMFAIIV